MNNLFYIIFIICLATLNVNAQTLTSGVYTELLKFPNLPPNYVESLPTLIHQMLSQKELAYKNTQYNNCNSKTTVKYINQLTITNNSIINDFESGFVLIDVSMCFSNTTIDKVMNLFTDTEFQKNNVSTIKSVYYKNNLICEKTYVPTIGKSHYCYVWQTLKQAGSILNISFNEWNDSIENADAQVYFREVMATATQTNNNVNFHLQTMVRGPKLSSFKKIMAENFIITEQNNIYEKMKQQLKN